MKRIAMMTLALLALAVPVAAEPEAVEMIDNPEFTSWKDFKVGTAITLRMVSESGSTKSKMETTTTLKSKSASKLVLTMSMETFVTIPGQGEKKIATPAQDREVPAKFKKMALPEESADVPKPEVKEGEETLEILGKSYKCKWGHSTLKMGGVTTTTKSWTSADVPGQLVKMTSSTEGPVTSKTEMVLIKLKMP